MENIAIIDIGSNSARLGIFNGSAKLTKKTVISCMLIDKMSDDKTLDFFSVQRATNAVISLVNEAKKIGYSEIFIFATEAVRSAKNGAEFTQNLQSKINIAVDVIDGGLEAQIGFMGIMSIVKTSATAIDIGGASAEIICGDRKKIAYKKSLPIGAVRLMNNVGNNKEKLNDYAREFITAYGDIPQTAKAIAIGGTATTIAAMLQNLSVYDMEKVDNFAITLAALQGLEDIVFSRQNLRELYPTLSENREKIIRQGIVLLKNIMLYLKVSFVIVSERDNMEGYLAYRRPSFFPQKLAVE